MKNKKMYECSNCGVTSAKWVGRCFNCDAWDTFLEINSNPKKLGLKKINSEPIKLSEISSDNFKRISSGINEFDRVLGSGIVPGSLILIGGDPGIGKSTLMLQLCNKSNNKVLYVTGEESPGQIKSRAERIKGNGNDFLLLSDNSLENISLNIKSDDCEIAIIDSVQSIQSDEIDSPAGSVIQIRECTYRLMKLAKELNKAIFLIGHITKEGSLAGPKLLEHLVDTVIQFEGDQSFYYRILRSIKNRYGATGEIGVFEMTSEGLQEVTNPSGIFLQSYASGEAGVAVTAILEGTRPMLAEIQALVTPTGFSMPQRSSNGFDIKRLQMILSVLEKRMGINFFKHDVFVNITGGLTLNDPSADLAVISAIVSSYKNIPLPEKSIFFGETGLTGEIRSVQFPEKRLNEAEKMGFQKAFIPELKDQLNSKIQTSSFNKLSLALNSIFN